MTTVVCYASVSKYKTNKVIYRFTKLGDAWGHISSCPHGHELQSVVKGEFSDGKVQR